MINKISNTLKDKYYTYVPGEFLPIYIEGELANRRDFHLYKLKKLAIAADRAFTRAQAR